MKHMGSRPIMWVVWHLEDEMYPKMRDMSYEVFLYEVNCWLHHLVLYLTFRVCCRLWWKCFLSHKTFLSDVSLKTSHLESETWNQNRELNSNGITEPQIQNIRETNSTCTRLQQACKYIAYLKYQSLICFHSKNCLFPLCCENCLFHHHTYWMRTLI